MFMTEYDEEGVRQVFRDEGYEEGFEKGIEQGADLLASRLREMGVDESVVDAAIRDALAARGSARAR